MKKNIFLLSGVLAMALVAAFQMDAATRKVFLARHGQAGGDDAFFKETRESTLTPLGVEQAKLLGEYLKKIKFNGTIYASPMYRATQTAMGPAKALNKPIIAEPGLQEYSRPKSDKDIYGFAPEKRCMSAEQLKENFPMVVIPKDFYHPWRVKNETDEMREARMEQTLARLLATTKGDLLLVGHGACYTTFRKVLRKRGAKILKDKVWNACLFEYEIDENGKVVNQKCHTFNYLPNEMITSNYAMTLVPRPNDPRYGKTGKDKKKKNKKFLE